MTQAVSNFYLFINRKSRYQGENGFTNLKLDMDTNRNNVIQFNELESFINANKSEMNLDNVTRNDVYSIWGELDLSIKGYNRMATGDVSENGSLNASEEQNLTKKIELYSKIDKAINAAKTSLDNKLKLSGGQHDYAFNIDEDELYYRTADEMIKSNNININTNDNELEQIAKDVLMRMASEIIKEQVLNNDTYRQALNAVGLNDYSLLGDNDLKEILTTEIKNMIEQGKSTELIAYQIACIARSYLKFAQITPQYTETNGITAWDNNKGLNQLQYERLKQKYKTDIDVNDINNNDKYNDFIDELNKAIEDFINNKLSNLSTSGNFNTLFGQNIKDEFMSSPQLQLLNNIVELNGNDKNAFKTDKLGLLGLNADSLDNLLDSSTYKKYLKKAYEAIMADPKAYGIEGALNDMDKVKNAVLKYFKDHLKEMLEDSGCVVTSEDGSAKDKEEATAWALYYNFTSTRDIYINKKGSGVEHGNNVYKEEDVRNAAKQFRDYIASVYSNEPAVIEALNKKDSDGHSLANDIDKMSIYDLDSAMYAVLHAIAEVNADKEPEIIPPQLISDEYKPDYLNNGNIMLFKDGLVFDFANSGAFETDINKIIKNIDWPGEQCGYTYTQWDKARDTLKNYLMAVLHSFRHELFTNMKDGQDTPVTYTFTYKDEITGNDVTTTASSKAHKEGSDVDESNVNYVDGSAQTGVYVYCNNGWYDTYTIKLDGNRLWELFKGFLH